MNNHAAQQLPSLRARLVRHVVLPLAATWALGTALSVGIANYFAQQAFDRALLDDAYSLAANVLGEGEEMRLQLSSREINHVLFDQSESVFFAVLRLDGSLVSGHPGLRATPLEAGSAAPYAFGDIVYQGKSLRSVSLFRPKAGAFQVVLAQTRASRDHMLRNLLVLSIAPQLLLLILLALWMRRAIQSDLEPLKRLQESVDRRPAHDFQAFNEEASTRDVQQLAQALNQLLGRIEASVQAQREFTGNVAHELRTPLAGIRAQVEYGLAHAEPEVWQQQLKGVLGSQTRATHLVDQLLALALADEARLALKLEAVALDQLVRDAVLRFLARADALGVDLGARGVDDPVWVQANATLVEGMLNNLIDNALRYASAPGTTPAPQVTVELRTQGAELWLSVIDNGPGIATDMRERLTQRWVRGHADAQGSGLGLAIVGQYARTLGARLLLESDETGETGASAGPGGNRGLRASVVFALSADGHPFARPHGGAGPS